MLIMSLDMVFMYRVINIFKLNRLVEYMENQQLDSIEQWKAIENQSQLSKQISPSEIIVDRSRSEPDLREHDVRYHDSLLQKKFLHNLLEDALLHDSFLQDSLRHDLLLFEDKIRQFLRRKQINAF